MLALKVLPLFLASLSLVLTAENRTSGSMKSPSSRVLQRRYSEAILASDYSRTIDNMIKKNFVEWLLARREMKNDNAIDPYKREAEPQINSYGLKLGSQQAKDFFVWLLKNKRKQSFAFPEDSEVPKDALSQELLAWLISADPLRPRTQ